MRKKHICFFLLVSTFCYGQVDSLLLSVEKLYNKGNYKEVVSGTPKLMLPTSTEDSLYSAKILNFQSNAYYELGEYNKAIAIANRSILYSPNNEEGRNQKGVMLFDRAFSEYSLQDYQTSYTTVKEAESVLTLLKHPNLDYLLSIYADLAGTAITYGYYEEAEYYIKKGIRVYNNNKKQVIPNNNQASKDVLFQYKLIELYSAKKDEKKLIKQLGKFTQLKNGKAFNSIENLMYAVSLNMVGDFYLNNLGTIERNIALKQGRKYIEKAIADLDVNAYPSNEVQFKFNLAKLLRYSKEYEKALTINQEILKKVAAKDDRIPFFYAQRAIIHLEQKKQELAFKELYKMIDYIHQGPEKLAPNFENFHPSEELNHTGLLIEIPAIIKEYFPDSKQADQISSHMYQAGLIQFKNCYITEALSPKLRDYYHLILKGLLESETADTESILEDIEGIENRLAWKEFLQNRKHTQAVLPDSIFTQELLLRKQIVEARKRNDLSEVVALEKRIEAHRAYLKNNFPAISTSVLSDFNISAFQKELDDDACVLRYKEVGDRLYLFKITKNELDVFSLNFNHTFKKQLEHYITDLKNKKTNKDLAKELCKKLIPFSLEGIEHLTIVPDDILYHLPFETLVNDKSKYLIEKRAISYALYLVFIRNGNKPKDSNTLQIYNPIYNDAPDLKGPIALRGSHSESKHISSLFAATLFEGKESNKEVFFENAPKAKILHLSMHAAIDNEQPELSHFIFSDTPENKLYLEELYGAKLQADLAVLSACSTGEGTIDKIKGHISLQRSFTYAGVSATVSSLWEAPDDATKQIIISFYKYLKEGFNKAKSMQLAKLDYLKNNEELSLKAPYYWATFTVSGNTTPLESEKYWQYIFVGFVLLLVLIFRRKLRKRFKNF